MALENILRILTKINPRLDLDGKPLIMLMALIMIIFLTKLTQSLMILSNKLEIRLIRKVEIFYKAIVVH